MARLFEVLYFLVVVVEVFAEYQDLQWLRYATKPLLMIVLIAYYRSSGPGDTKLANLMTVALAFSWVGDVALMFTHINENFFLVGLAGFLVTHLLYIYCFNRASQGPSVLVPSKWWLLSPLVVYMALLMTALVPAILKEEATKPFLVPVAIYSATIGTMVVFAINRYKRTTSASFYWVLIGALLFMFSDSIIAINKFIEPVYMARVIIMITYTIGQYSIIRGLLKQ